MIPWTAPEKDYIPPRLRQAVLRRDRHRCRYCGSPKGPFHMDHVYPESRGGETSLNNLVTACKACNLAKSAKIGLWPLPIGYFEQHEPISIAKRILWVLLELLFYLAALGLVIVVFLLRDLLTEQWITLFVIVFLGAAMLLFRHNLLAAIKDVWR